MPRKAYKSDLSDREWRIIEPLIPGAKPQGHPRTVNIREVVKGIFYILKTGCYWEIFPDVYHRHRQSIIAFFNWVISSKTRA